MKSQKNRCLGLTLFSIVAVGSWSSAFAQQQAPQPLPLSELRAFTEAYYQIKSTYLTEVDDETLIRSAIKGMVENLDKHSRFLPPEEFEQFNTDNEGQYAGIGLSFIDHKFGIEVARVVTNSPASRAGIKPGMLITHIDQKEIKFLSSQDALLLLKGEVGSQVELVVASSEFAQPQNMTLQREIVILESVSSSRLPDNTGYVAISQFTLNSVDEFTAAMNELASGVQLEKLIIDLRDNPGGVLEIAVEMSDLFIDQGKLLTSSGRTQDANEVFYAHQFSPYDDLEVVVVINSGSASASEILAAALQDHKKAIILGEVSYGKGSIQTVVPLNLESGMKITTAEYFSPLGAKIQDIGVIPDVEFSDNKLANPYNVSLLDDPELLQAYNLLTEK